jgi:hypothetical protein
MLTKQCPLLVALLHNAYEYIGHKGSRLDEKHEWILDAVLATIEQLWEQDKYLSNGPAEAQAGAGAEPEAESEKPGQGKSKPGEANNEEEGNEEDSEGEAEENAGAPHVDHRKLIVQAHLTDELKGLLNPKLQCPTKTSGEAYILITSRIGVTITHDSA